jgi:hypothetical protein
MKKSLLLTIGCLLLINSHAQNVGINATGAAPVSSAALDVDIANKGILIPRVALTSLTTFAPVTGTPTVSLLIYNTAVGGVYPNNFDEGYYYWDGSRWLRFVTQTNVGWQLNDIYTVTTTAPVDVTVTQGVTVDNLNLNMPLSITIPPNYEARMLLSYSTPMGLTLGLGGFYYGVRALRNGIEMPSGSRKVTFVPSGTPLFNMTTISSQYLDTYVNNTGAPVTINYALNGYIEPTLTSGINTIRYNMWSAIDPNYNWGRGNFVIQLYLRPL